MKWTLFSLIENLRPPSWTLLVVIWEKHKCKKQNADGHRFIDCHRLSFFLFPNGSFCLLFKAFCFFAKGEETLSSQAVESTSAFCEDFQDIPISPMGAFLHCQHGFNPKSVFFFFVFLRFSLTFTGLLQEVLKNRRLSPAFSEALACRKGVSDCIHIILPCQRHVKQQWTSDVFNGVWCLPWGSRSASPLGQEQLSCMRLNSWGNKGRRNCRIQRYSETAFYSENSKVERIAKRVERPFVKRCIRSVAKAWDNLHLQFGSKLFAFSRLDTKLLEKNRQCF